MNPIQMSCYCGNSHCSGEIYIQEDTIKGEKLFMVTVIDSKGNDEGSTWLTPDQLYELGELCMAAARLAKENEN